MSASPLIFVSAVSAELGPARELCARLLTGLGYQPDWQDVFPTEAGELLRVLDRKVARADAVLALIGCRYGVEPPTPTAEFGRVSYTQYEVLRARQLGRKTILLFCDGYPAPTALAPESAQLAALQESYCARLRAGSHLYRTADSPLALEIALLKLRDDLAATRRRFRVWLAAVLVVAVAGVAIGAWQIFESARMRRGVEATSEKVDTLLLYAAATRELPEIDAAVKTARPDLKGAAADEAVYEDLAKKLGVDARILSENLPAYAAALKADPKATLLDRANAAYTAKDYAEAERLGLAAAHEAQAARPPRISEVIHALATAGWSAHERIEYERALAHFRSAATYTDQTRDGAEWADVQHAIAYVLVHLDRTREAEPILRAVVAERTRVLGPEDPDTLRSRNNRAAALDSQGRPAEAEQEHRAVGMVQERILGPEHPDSLRSRTGVANALYSQGKYAEAEVEYLAVCVMQERILGLEHPETLASRDNLAVARNAQGKPEEAEAEHREIGKIRARLLGPEHPDTLRTRMNLATALDTQGRSAEAEAEYRVVWQARERVLGPEHPDTLRSRMNLANALYAQRKLAEAETEYRAVWRAQERDLGREHPDTLRTRMNLASTLGGEGHFAKAEAEYRAVWKMQERVLAPDHLETLTSRVGLAWVLDEQSRYAEAETENRALFSICERKLGSGHPVTLNVRCNLAGNLVGLGKFAEAEGEARSSLAGREKLFGLESHQAAESLWQVAKALRGLGRINDARDFAKRAAECALKTLSGEHPYTKLYTALYDELRTE